MVSGKGDGGAKICVGALFRINCPGQGSDAAVLLQPVEVDRPRVGLAVGVRGPGPDRHEVAGSGYGGAVLAGLGLLQLGQISGRPVGLHLIKVSRSAGAGINRPHHQKVTRKG